MNIRCSALPFYCDCPRKAAAGLFWKEIKTAGFKIPYVKKQVSAHIGAGVHAGAETLLKESIKTGIKLSLGNSIDSSMQAYRKEIYEGVQFDDITSNNNEAEKQIQILMRSYYYEVYPKKDLTNALIECEMQAQDGEFLLTGHSDFINDIEIEDLKTGRVSNYAAQNGGYSLLHRSRTGKTAKRLVVDFCQRTHLSKNYPGAAQQEYNVYTSEKYAFNIIKLIQKLLLPRHISREVYLFPLYQPLVKI